MSTAGNYAQDSNGKAQLDSSGNRMLDGGSGNCCCSGCCPTGLPSSYTFACTAFHAPTGVTCLTTWTLTEISSCNYQGFLTGINQCVPTTGACQFSNLTISLLTSNPAAPCVQTATSPCQWTICVCSQSSTQTTVGTNPVGAYHDISGGGFSITGITIS